MLQKVKNDWKRICSSSRRRRRPAGPHGCSGPITVVERMHFVGKDVTLLGKENLMTGFSLLTKIRFFDKMHSSPCPPSLPRPPLSLLTNTIRARSLL